MQLVELGHQGLDEGGDGDGLLGAGGDVADPELQGLEVGVGPHVPPDLLAVVDAVGAHQQLDVAAVVVPGAVGVRDLGAREPLEDRGAHRLHARLPAAPEGRVHREREHVGQEGAHAVHDVDLGFSVFDADVDMEAEDEVGPGQVLHLVHDVLVARAVRDLLVLPVADGVGARGHDAHPARLGHGDERAPEVLHRVARVGDVLAHRRAHLHHAAVQLGLDLVAQVRARGQHLLDVALQLAGLGIDELELFLDAQGEAGRHDGFSSKYSAALPGRPGPGRRPR